MPLGILDGMLRRLAALAVVAVLLTAAAGCGLFGRGDGPEDAARAFAAAWAGGDDRAAAARTDDPAAAGALLAGVREALAPAALAVTVGQVRAATDTATASLDVRFDLGQGRIWSYHGEAGLHRTADGTDGPAWTVAWAPTVVHPQLAAGQRLVLRTGAAEPAPVVDRAGVPLLEPGDVVTILLDRLQTGDLPKVAGALAEALGPIEPSITAQSIVDGAARTPDGRAYTVAVLRDTDYRTVKDAVHELPGVRFTTAQRLLAPDAGFARQVLPAVRAGTAAQLDGVPGWSIAAVAPGGTVATLVEEAPKPGTTVAVTLDRALQVAAEDAVEPLGQQAVLVAVQPSTGSLLAVAQNGAADAAGALALTGRYPPGSTFKIVTALAAVEGAGLRADTPVACPGETVIGGRPVPNKGGFDLGTVPLTRAFAKSCNTTFATIGAGLAPDALPAAALQLGLGADFAVPTLTTVTGSVPDAPEPVARAEDAFGQGQVLASPLGMALVAATVARGAPVVPQLLPGRPTEVTRPATAPDAAALEQVRAMMRAVVTEGTATALGGLGEVRGKTGTAEYTNDGRAHGWFVGYRGDLALAVLVVDGGSSEPAVAAAGRFLAKAPQ